MSGESAVFSIGTIARGRLAIAAHPALAGDAEAVIGGLAADGFKQLVSLLEADEARQLGLGNEAAIAAAHSLAFRHYPVPDMGLPESASGFARLAQDLHRQLASGVDTLVHCRGGIGRSGLLAAAILLQQGLAVQQAFDRVAEARGQGVPETAAQGEWLVANRDLVAGGGVLPRAAGATL